MSSQRSFPVLIEISESGFGEAVDHLRDLPKVIVGSKLMRNDVEAFSNRFMARPQAAISLMVRWASGLGTMLFFTTGIDEVLLSQGGVTPNPAHILSFLRLDQRL